MEVLGDYADFPQAIDPINLLFFKMSGYENMFCSVYVNYLAAYKLQRFSVIVSSLKICSVICVDHLFNWIMSK